MLSNGPNIARGFLHQGGNREETPAVKDIMIEKNWTTLKRICTKLKIAKPTATIIKIGKINNRILFMFCVLF